MIFKAYDFCTAQNISQGIIRKLELGAANEESVQNMMKIRFGVTSSADFFFFRFSQLDLS